MNVHQITLQGYGATGGIRPSMCSAQLYLGTAGSYGNEQIIVTQGEGWQNLTVKATFQPSGVVAVVPAGGGAIDVPWEATQTPLPYPQGRIVFQGYTNSQLVNSYDVPYVVSATSAGSDGTPDPTPDEFQQFVQQVLASAKAAANSATEAAGSASAAAGSASAAAGSAQQAADTLQQVQEAGQQATEDIGTAQSDAIKAVGDVQSAAVQAVQGQQQTSVGAVQAAGTAAVDQVNQTGQQQVQAVNTAGDTKLDEINTAIAHPPQPNTATGFWQIWNAETGKYEDTAAIYQGGYYTPSVAEDGTLTWTGSQAGMPELPSANIRGPQGLGVPTPSADAAGQVPTVNDTGDGYLLTGPYAPLEASIRPTANGNPAVCEDSIAWAFQGLKVYGKSTQVSNQLLPLTQPTYTGGGLTGTVQGDGSIIVNGTPESDVVNVFYIPLTLSPGTYYISGGEKVSGAVVAFVSVTSSSGTAYYANQSFTVSGNETSIVAMLQSADTQPINNYRVEAMLNAGSSPLPLQSYTPTPESPVSIVSAGEGGGVEIAVTGKNLLNMSRCSAFVKSYGLTPVIDGDSVLISGTATVTMPIAIFAILTTNDEFLVGRNFKFSWFTDQAITSISGLGTNNKINLAMSLQEGQSYNFAIKISVWLEKLDAWEPYTGQSLPLSTPSGLPGIPVESGGNYIDASGQQLTSDYWDFGDGQQHILCGEIASYNGEEITTPYISSTGALTTGAQVLYVLPKPRTEPIPAETMAAYRALITYPGTTVVSTAEPVAGIEARYIMDGTAAWNKVTTALAQLSAANTQTSQVVNTMLGASE